MLLLLVLLAVVGAAAAAVAGGTCWLKDIDALSFQGQTVMCLLTGFFRTRGVCSE